MYEKLVKEIEEEDIKLLEIKMENNLKGLYCDNCIALNTNIATYKEKACVLSEELGHYHTSYGNILDQSCISNRKQERLARVWGYKRLVSIKDFIDAYKEGVSNRYELADYLNVTEQFIDECISYYKEKYGLYYEVDNYVVYFEPLGVFEIFF